MLKTLFKKKKYWTCIKTNMVTGKSKVWRERHYPEKEYDVISADIRSVCRKSDGIIISIGDKDIRGNEVIGFSAPMNAPYRQTVYSIELMVMFSKNSGLPLSSFQPAKDNLC